MKFGTSSAKGIWYWCNTMCSTKVWVRKNRAHSNMPIHSFCPILKKFGGNDSLMRQSFFQSFMRIGHKLWIFYKWTIFERGPFFYVSDFRSLKKVLSTKKAVTLALNWVLVFIILDELLTALIILDFMKRTSLKLH